VAEHKDRLLHTAGLVVFTQEENTMNTLETHNNTTPDEFLCYPCTVHNAAGRFKVRLVDAERMRQIDPDTRQHMNVECLPDLPKGTLVQVCYVPVVGTDPSERLWVRITRRETSEDQTVMYYGELLADTLVFERGDVIGPMPMASFHDIDIEYRREDLGMPNPVSSHESALWVE
jgi:hypothetical protein